MPTFKDARRLQGERVRMRFDDGREVVARLLCATKDIDGSRHLIYEMPEPAEEKADAPCAYADGKSLVHIEHAEAKPVSSGPRGHRFKTWKVA